jgi:hypothetical protein
LSNPLGYQIRQSITDTENKKFLNNSLEGPHMATGVVSGHRSCPVGTGGAEEYGGGLPAGSQLPQPIGFRNAAGEKKALVKMMGQKKSPLSRTTSTVNSILEKRARRR